MYMNYPLYQILIIFAAYSVAGWIAETMIAELVGERYVNKGILRGPYCPGYGIAALLLLVVSETMDMTLPQVFISGMLIGIAVEQIGCLAVRILSGVKMWKCHQVVTWGVFSLIAVINIKPAVLFAVRCLPLWVHFVFLALFFMHFVEDAVDSFMAVIYYRKNIRKLREQNIRPESALDSETQYILGEYRYLMRAYPYLKKDMRRKITK